MLKYDCVSSVCRCGLLIAASPTLAQQHSSGQVNCQLQLALAGEQWVMLQAVRSGSSKQLCCLLSRRQLGPIRSFYNSMVYRKWACLHHNKSTTIYLPGAYRLSGALVTSTKVHCERAWCTAHRQHPVAPEPAGQVLDLSRVVSSELLLA